ncbi:hypothetical protein D023_0410A, partial [Vibrio parahaemolyticus 3256]
MAWTGFG